ncbi:CCA tRNA nucleotidyltransferase [Mangrovibacillus cuniculi]|uniref:CCA-adding enzyme n=2 Tax=Mangrovibacillus cuniculi TaxID=2593652 RepID=A0A7S8CEB7_9BACI|nr:CCA tRNA nucleotidyltransferase [Mangrovibacillus cuniculi]
MLSEQFKQALPILKKIEEAGFQAYFVGGAVRDLIIGREVNDVDIATSALPQEVKGIFPKTVDVGIEHGTILVIHNGEGYEITTFRTEKGYEDFRRPSEVSFVRNLEEDLQRRDFTINAIAMNANGEFVDPFNGLEDIEQKVIRTVGSADERFQEDALRMMRAIRFQSQLGFTMDKTCREGLENNAALLEHIAIERKLQEFEKLLLGEYVSIYWADFLSLKLSDYLPGIKRNRELLKLFHTFRLSHLTITERWTLLFYCLKIDDPSTLLKQWKASNKRIKDCRLLLQVFYQRLQRDWTDYDLYNVELPTILSIEKLMNSIGNSYFSKKDIEERIDTLAIKNGDLLAVTGKDLQAWANKKGGPWIKECLELIEKEILSRNLPNEKDAIEKWVMNEWLHRSNNN